MWDSTPIFSNLLLVDNYKEKERKHKMSRAVRFAEWYTRNFSAWTWESEYQSISYVAWILMTFVGMLVVGFSCTNVILSFTVLLSCAQLLSVIQECVRWFAEKKHGNTETQINPGNIFASIVGIIFGALYACIVWIGIRF